MVKNKKVLLGLLSILGVLLVLIGTTYALFSYSRLGSKMVTMTTDGITFTYREGQTALTLNDAMPMTDEEGMEQENYFEFEIKSKTPKRVEIPYNITARKLDSSSDISDAITLYLTTVDDEGNEEEVKLVKFDSMSQYINDTIDVSSHVEKALYASEVPEDTNNYNQKYRLRMWINYDADFTQAKYNGATFKISLNVYANGREAGLETVKSYIAKAEEYYDTVSGQKAVKLGTNIIDRLDLEDISEKDQIVLTEDGKTEVAVVKNNKCYRKSALSDDIEVIGEEYCDVNVDKFASNNGRLHVEGTKLLNERGKEVRLTGTSLETDLVEMQQVYSIKSLNTLKNWGSNVLRVFIAADCAYYSKHCYNGDEDNYINYLFDTIDNAIANDMYVILNWNPGSSDPKTDRAIGLFNRVTNHYPNSPYILYELWNEPTAESMTWDKIKNYANEVIPIIRNISPDSVILSSVPYSADIQKLYSESPLLFENIMYTFHAYSNSMSDERLEQLLNAIEGGVPMFVTEWGSVYADENSPYRNDEICESYGTDFAKLLKKYNISYTYYASQPSEWSLGFTEYGKWKENLPDSILRNNGKFFKKIVRDDLDYDVHVMIGDANDKKLYYRSDEWREKIISIEFKNKLEVPATAVVQWDLSMARDNSVIGYLIPSSEEDRYKLVICANGKINAPINSRRLFADLTNVETIDFTNFVTTNVRIMNAMFLNDGKLQNLDVSGFDVSKVLHMSSMFQNCSSLKSINFDNWNGEIFGVDGMLFGCRSLESVDLSSINANGSNLNYVFGGGIKLKRINISSWNPATINTMKYMFQNLKNIEYIDMSSMDIPATADFTDAFYQFATTSKNVTIKVKNKRVKEILEQQISTSDGVNVTYTYKYETEESGKTGKVKWKFSPQNCTLSITGTGNMADYSLENKAPWYKYKDDICKITVGENVTKLGEYAFYDLAYVKDIRIDSVKLQDLKEDTVNTGLNYTMYNVGTKYGATLTFGPNVTYIPKMLLQPGDYMPPLNITNVVFEGNKIANIGAYGLANLNVDGLFLTEGIKSGSAMALGYGKMYIMVLPDSLTNINANNVLNANHNLEKLVFGETIEKIPSNTISNNEKLNTIVIPKIQDTNVAATNTFNKNRTNTVTIYGDSSTKTWVDNVKNASGQTNLVYKELSEYHSTITSNTDISGTVGYNEAFTFTAEGNVKAYYTYTTSAGKVVRSNELNMTKSGNTYTINNIKQDIYIEVE